MQKPDPALMTNSPRPDPFELVGTTIAGKYDVEQIVAQTALSVVYRATHRVWQRSVAIKAFTAPSLSDEARQQLLASFVEEGRLLMDLSERCASICQARDVSSLTTSRGDWVPYTVLEWLDGECLEVLLRRERGEHGDLRQPRTLAAVIELLNPIAEALAIAHERGIVHRDVKPGNIFILSDGGGEAPRAKLLDFGVAKVMRGAAAVPAGAVVSQSFTPSYGAPEQFSAAYGTTGPWTDVYALGLIVVELLTGREALRGDAVGGLAQQSCDPAVRPTARALGAVVTDDVELVLERALAVRLEDRFANARELWSALRDALAAQPLEGSAHETQPFGGHERRAQRQDVGDEGEIDVAWELPEATAEVALADESPPSSEAVSISEGPPSLTIPIALNRRRVTGEAPHTTEEAT
jgi:eukaryotic-like serine/threonine-protein kinase